MEDDGMTKGDFHAALDQLLSQKPLEELTLIVICNRCRTEMQHDARGNSLRCRECGNMIGAQGVWTIFANDMRWPKADMKDHIFHADTREILLSLIKHESVPMYWDEHNGKRFQKTFRKEGPLEWINRESIELIDMGALFRRTIDAIPRAPKEDT